MTNKSRKKNINTMIMVSFAEDIERSSTGRGGAAGTIISIDTYMHLYFVEAT